MGSMSTNRSTIIGPTESDLKDAFGPNVRLAPVATEDRLGRRVTGIDLSRPLTPEQASLVIALLDAHRLVSYPGQDEHSFNVNDLERLANHFGAVITHPKNYRNYRERGQELRLLPVVDSHRHRVRADPLVHEHVLRSANPNRPRLRRRNLGDQSAP